MSGKAWFQFWCAKRNGWISFQGCLDNQQDFYLKIDKEHPCANCPVGAAIRALENVPMTVLEIEEG